MPITGSGWGRGLQKRVIKVLVKKTNQTKKQQPKKNPKTKLTKKQARPNQTKP